MNKHRPLISLRKLLSALIALAVLFAPAVTNVAAAHAGVGNHQAQMMQMGHCSSMPSRGHEKSDGKSCCISMTVAAAFAPDHAAARLSMAALRPVSFIPTMDRPHLGEIATPPPRDS